MKTFAANHLIIHLEQILLISCCSDPRLLSINQDGPKNSTIDNQVEDQEIFKFF